MPRRSAASSTANIPAEKPSLPSVPLTAYFLHQMCGYTQHHVLCEDRHVRRPYIRHRHTPTRALEGQQGKAGDQRDTRRHETDEQTLWSVVHRVHVCCRGQARTRARNGCAGRMCVQGSAEGPALATDLVEPCTI